MLMLVMSNNFLQLFFGWEAVGLVSYLLIGFWYKRPTAIFANLQGLPRQPRSATSRFIVGDRDRRRRTWAASTTPRCSQRDPRARSAMTSSRRPAKPSKVITVICVGAVPRRDGQVRAGAVARGWLPDSMEGPTPISALIHAATMVTAGIFMVARHVAAVRDVAGRAAFHRRDRRDHGALHGPARPRQQRHQARDRVSRRSRSSAT